MENLEISVQSKTFVKTSTTFSIALLDAAQGLCLSVQSAAVNPAAELTIHSTLIWNRPETLHRKSYADEDIPTLDHSDFDYAGNLSVCVCSTNQMQLGLRVLLYIRSGYPVLHDNPIW